MQYEIFLTGRVSSVLRPYSWDWHIKMFMMSALLIKHVMPEFELQDMTGNIISSKSYEYDEQKLLCNYVHSGDHVLQLGANIGTSCI
jgi:hypothetical protein